MRDKHVGPALETTPPDSKTPAGENRSLPSDLMDQASRRLGIVALTAAIVWILATALDHLSRRALDPNDRRWLEPQLTDGVAILNVIVSVSLLLYTRRRGRRISTNLGLAYMVLTAFGIGAMLHWQPGMPVLAIVSFVSPLMMMFAAIVPAPPWKMFVACLAAATMNPVTMLIARAEGIYQFSRLRDLLVMHYEDYLVVGVAVLVSTVVAGFGREVRKARELGSYRLGDLISRGGMGEVYRATHRMLARPAAIKLIRPELMGADNPRLAEEVIRRFRQEAEVAASLRSPHTVSLYDFGTTDDGTLYFVMELLEGFNLESLVERHGPVPASRTIHILRQVCESLEEAHARSLVHRDIKPANIHIGRLGVRYDFVKVLDFGVVKSGIKSTDRPMAVTGADVTIGTPSTMAPETALGEAVDGRADIYGLGCVAYFLLTGRPVFEGSDVIQLVARHLHHKPVAPSSVAELPVPPSVDAVVLACLEKKPEDRPQGARELAGMLAACPVEPWTEEQSREWWAASGEP